MGVRDVGHLAPAVLAGRSEVLAESDEPIVDHSACSAHTATAAARWREGCWQDGAARQIAARAAAAHGWPHVHVEVTPSALFARLAAESVASTFAIDVYFPAGEGTPADSATAWQLRLAERRAEADAIASRSFHSAGGTILYHVAGPKQCFRLGIRQQDSAVRRSLSLLIGAVTTDH